MDSPVGVEPLTAVVVVLELALQVRFRLTLAGQEAALPGKPQSVNHLVLFTQGSLAAVA